MNIEANHATLAGHTFQHDLRVSAINGMLGSIDANQGDLLLGWDTDEFPSNILGMDTFALGLIKAAQIIEDGRIDAFVDERYQRLLKIWELQNFLLAEDKNIYKVLLMELCFDKHS